MANYLKESKVYSIQELARNGWSQRRIARELGMSRMTVSRYLQGQQRGPVVTAGSGGSDQARGVIGEAGQSGPEVTAGSGGSDQARGAMGEAGQSRPLVTAGAAGEKQPEVTAVAVAERGPEVTAGFERRQSLCLPYEVLIGELAEQGLTAQRIWQDLVTEHGFGGSYSSVKRFVRQLLAGRPEPFRRLESPPGEEAQVDFGKGAMVIGEDGRRRRPHLFRIVLSHSRKGYSEVVWRQDTESFIRALENAFRHFGGVPRTLVPDNLKAAVIRADWAEPELNPKLADFCRHYGTVLLPTKVRTPRHKGKVEHGVGYAQSNALKGRTFGSLDEQNGELRWWEQNVADTRIHGTTRKQVAAAFAAEKPHLLPLPASLFPVFEEGTRKVHRDGHVEVARSYYSAPPELLGRELLVRWDLRTVRLFHPLTRAQLRVHPRVEPGSFHTDPADIPATKIALVERGEHYLLERIGREIGDHAVAWSRAMLKARGIAGIRVLVGLLSLGDNHDADRLDAACREARKRQQWQLRPLRQLVAEPPAEQLDLDLQQQHDIIRDLGVYQRLVGTFTR